MIQFTKQNGSLSVHYNHLKVIDHSPDRPAVAVRHSKEEIDMYRGNYFIEDEVVEEVPLRQYTLSESYVEGKAVSTLTFFSKGVDRKSSCRERV